MSRRSDPQLLRAYAEEHSEAAFGELVRRHVDFVYSAALRMVRDAHLAEDVTQAVFVAVARNARPLARCSVLSGWLHRTTQNIAAQTVRTEVRRRHREQEAVAMNEMHSAEPDATWEQVAPHIDAALGELTDTDRDAILLRYFERQSARDMAQTLGISDEAAQKRVNRAVERLRELFVKRGVPVGTSGLAVILSGHAVQAAPPGLVVAVSSATTLAVSSTITALAMTTLQKSLVALGIAATVAMVGGGFVAVSHLRRHSPPAQQTPGTVPALTDNLPEEHTFKMGDHLAGVVAPAIVGRAFTIVCVFDSQQQDGVIIAQGGLAHGYALYVQGGELCFAIRRNNELTTVSAGSVGAGRHTATASFTVEGELRLALDGQAPATARARGPITLTPVDGLDVGIDRGAMVGPYTDANQFGGTIEKLTLRFERPPAR